MTPNDNEQKNIEETKSEVKEPYAPPLKDKTHMKEVWKGVGLTALLHLITVFISFFAIFAIVSIGVVQLLYVIPVTLYYYNKKRIGMVQGLLIGAGVTFLLNVACFGLVIASFS